MPVVISPLAGEVGGGGGSVTPVVICPANSGMAKAKTNTATALNLCKLFILFY